MRKEACETVNQSIVIEPQMLASAYIPFQISEFDALYEPDEALEKGTVFPELHLPGLGYDGGANYAR